MKNGFTLIELLAVLIILAIITLIVVPVVLNLINASKKKSIEVSVQNYLRAVEVSIMNKDSNNYRILDGTYNIREGGKILDYLYDENSENDIVVKFDGQVISSGTIKIKNNSVESIINAEFDKYVINLNKEETSIKDSSKLKKSELIRGANFNRIIKTLANGVDVGYSSEDNVIKSIEFYSNGSLPQEYKTTSVEDASISVSNDELIKVYNDNGKVIVYSDNLISFNRENDYMFYNMSNIEYIKLGMIDSSKMTTVYSMFSQSSNLKYIDINNLDTSQVSKFGRMFSGCSSLTNLDLSDLNTNKVLYMSRMFNKCSELAMLYLDGFNTDQVLDMRAMFQQTKKLKIIFVGENWQISDTTDTTNMFYNSATPNIEHLCTPTSTHEWCTLPS